MATFAVVHLRASHQAPMQKSELLQMPAQGTANPDIPKLSALSGASGAQQSIRVRSVRSSLRATSANTAPADLVAAIPAGLPSSLREAAAVGDPGAEFELAVRLVDGRDVAKDPHAAAQWFEQAAAHDLPLAQYRLGTLYEKGIGVARDPAARHVLVLEGCERRKRARHAQPGGHERRRRRRRQARLRRSRAMVPQGRSTRESATANSIWAFFTPAAWACRKTSSNPGCGSLWPRSRATPTLARSATKWPPRWT